MNFLFRFPTDQRGLRHLTRASIIPHNDTNSNSTTAAATEAELRELHLKIQQLERELQLAKLSTETPQPQSSSNSQESVNMYPGKWWNQKYPINDNRQQECEREFGFQLIERWNNSEQVVCSPSKSESSASKSQSSLLSSSKMRCWSVQYDNGVPTRPDNTWCAFENVLLDGDRISRKNRPTSWGQEFFDFQEGAIRGSCTKDEKFISQVNRLFQHGLEGLYGSFTEAQNDEDRKCDEWIEHPVYLVRRWEYHNLYHQMTDFFNAWMASEVTGIPTKQWQVVFNDFHDDDDNPLVGAWQDVFSPDHKVKYLHNLVRAGKRVCFRNLIVALPGYQSSIYISNHHPTQSNGCSNSDLVRAFSRFVVRALGFADKPAPSKPSITFIYRRDHKKNPYHDGRVARKIANDAQLVEKLAEAGGNSITVRGVDFQKMSFRDQIELMRSTNILVGMHGAGLANLFFLPEQAIVVEFGDNHGQYMSHHYFRNFAHWAGKTYLAWKNWGEGTAIRIDEEDFKNMMEVVIRMSRFFGYGSSVRGF